MRVVIEYFGCLPQVGVQRSAYISRKDRWKNGVKNSAAVRDMITFLVHKPVGAMLDAIYLQPKPTVSG